MTLFAPFQCSLLAEGAGGERGLIVGDAVVGNPPGQLSRLRERVMDDPARLRRSVHQLVALDFDTILVGDGVSIVADAKQRLQELVNSFPLSIAS